MLGTGKRRLVTATAVLASVLGASSLQFAGAGSGSAAPRTQTTTSITVYSGQHPQTTAKLVSAFEAATGIHVNLRNDDEDVLAQTIATEGSRAPADVFYTENSPALAFLQEKGLLAKVNSSTLRAVPAKYSSSAGYWVGVSARTSVLIYNTTHLRADQLPNSVLDLANKKWAGKLAIAPGETDFQPIITSVVHRYGQTKALAWLNAVKANAAGHNYPDNETLVAKVNSGQAWIGIINHYYWYRLREELGSGAIHSGLHYLASGDAGYVLDVSGAAALRSSTHLAAAQRFLAFLVGKKAQQIIATSNSYEYPIGSGVVTAKALKPFSTLRPTNLSLSDLGDGSVAVGLLQRAGLL